MTREPKTLKAGMVSALRGVDSGRHPALLEDGQLSFAVNTQLRGGFPATRPRLSKKTLVFENEDDQAWFEDHPIQGYTRTAFLTPDKGLIVVSVGGRIFRISPQDNFAVMDITPDAGNVPSLPLAWLEQAEQYLIIQNGVDAALIYDGALIRRADPAMREVPTGTAMCYNEEIGRLCVAVGTNEIQIGDVVGGPTGILKFTETGYLAEGGKFRVPLKYGKVKAMSMIANLDRSNGQGPMVVFAEEGLSTFNLPPNRDKWKELDYPPQVNMPIRYSAMSQNSIVMVNGDLFYRAKDGLRSFLYALREFQAPGNVAVSSEMDRVISKDTQGLLRFACGMLFDNRILFSLSPAPSANGTYHRGWGSLDLNLISRMGTKAPPTYDGLWTGVRPTGMLTGTFDEEERAFIFALNSDNENELWELHREVGYDNTESRVGCALETRMFNFNNPFEMKDLQNVEVWVDNVRGPVTMGVQWRSDSFSCYTSFCKEAELCATDKDCVTADDDDCKALESFNPGYRTRLNFGQPSDACDELDKKPLRKFFECQFRVYWSGQCRIRRILARANQVDEEVFPPAV